jgi:transposase
MAVTQEVAAMKKYRVTLTAEERDQLTALLAAGRASATKQAHARILLKADESEGGPAWADTRIAEAVEVSVATVERTRERFVEQGFAAALVRKPQARPSRLAKIDGAAEARLLTLACSKPPKGRAAWTMQLLADRLIELKVVESVSDETVRKTLKNYGGKPCWRSRSMIG